MGGGSGGGLLSSDIRSLEDKVKQRLAEAKEDVSRHVFISFDHEDLDEVNLLRGQAKNDKTDLQFDDYSVKEPYDSTNADYIKRNIREKIEDLSRIMNEVLLAAREQTRTAQEGARQVELGAAEASQNASASAELSASTHEIQLTADELARVSERLAAMVANFRV